jgi:hypothetical protein
MGILAFYLIELHTGVSALMNKHGSMLISSFTPYGLVCLMDYPKITSGLIFESIYLLISELITR